MIAVLKERSGVVDDGDRYFEGDDEGGMPMIRYPWQGVLALGLFLAPAFGVAVVKVS